MEDKRIKDGEVGDGSGDEIEIQKLHNITKTASQETNHRHRTLCNNI